MALEATSAHRGLLTQRPKGVAKAMRCRSSRPGRHTDPSIPQSNCLNQRAACPKSANQPFLAVTLACLAFVLRICVALSFLKGGSQKKTHFGF